MNAITINVPESLFDKLMGRQKIEARRSISRCLPWLRNYQV